MWVKFPPGATNVNVERQNYIVEATDAAGASYCRVPDHFVPRLQAVGFVPCDPPEGTDLPDLPRADPIRDEAIAGQVGQIASLSATVEQLRTDNSALSANLAATMHERDELKLKVHELTVEIGDLTAENTELRESAPIEAVKAANSKRENK